MREYKIFASFHTCVAARHLFCPFRVLQTMLQFLENAKEEWNEELQQQQKQKKKNCSAFEVAKVEGGCLLHVALDAAYRIVASVVL